jgi:hypothetical protein
LVLTAAVAHAVNALRSLLHFSSISNPLLCTVEQRARWCQALEAHNITAQGSCCSGIPRRHGAREGGAAAAGRTVMQAKKEDSSSMHSLESLLPFPAILRVLILIILSFVFCFPIFADH